MGRLKVLDGRGEEIGYREKQTTKISSLVFLSFVEILAMIYKLPSVICQFVKCFKKTKTQTLQISG